MKHKKNRKKTIALIISTVVIAALGLILVNKPSELDKDIENFNNTHEPLILDTEYTGPNEDVSIKPIENE